jgi:nicotinamide mononucleotide transporter
MKKMVQPTAVFLVLAAVAYATNSTWIEVVASVSGLFSVWLAAKENVWYYPVGFVNIVTFAYIFHGVQLYADFMLQLVFFALSVYGWWIWLTKREGRPVRPTTSLTRRGWGILLAAVPIIAVLWGLLLNRYTDASIPYLDAFVATLSMAAQYLLSRKVLQNWYLWIAVDTLSIGMYWYKGLYMISFTYFVFLVICISGLLSWRKGSRV